MACGLLNYSPGRPKTLQIGYAPATASRLPGHPQSTPERRPDPEYGIKTSP